ncbi:iron(III) transport system ATP-binding protein [Povalibacter uvarum]|uniref:Iron(III) transport system ATP-binding protein n=1 Tax=Povalibacter uvarum TaxID=732238 RepID=A0A841HSN1_9GAMM|nr:ABC transporter ATP-binding protein [Povalibacter uvarum]MBB6095664.1 iron(III) transport system ATP-binding protein [Povalibacter uvarum]
MWLELQDVARSFGSHRAVDGLSLQLARGSIGCLLGPSGCGKTTALRCIAGFEPVDRGSIRAHDRLLAQPGLALSPSERQIGMVFQDYALFPHVTALENVAFGLHRLPGPSRKRRAEEMLATVGLGDSGAKYPHQLSGGQQQRVALARALAPEPELVLLDEPFSSLDIELRERLSAEVRAVLKSLNTTALLVTHDQQEAFAVADVVGVMNQGRLEQWDAPYELYHRPASRFVADFIGQGVFIAGEIVGGNSVQTEVGVMHANGSGTWERGTAVDLLLRPDDVIHDDESTFKAEVCQRAFRGAEFLYTLKLPSGARLLSLVPSHHNHAVGEKIGIRIEPDHVVAFEKK